MREPCKANSEAVDLPEIGPCFVRGLTMRERGQLSQKIDQQSTIYDPILILISTMVVDVENQCIWDTNNWDIWAGKYDAEAGDLFKTAQRIAGLGIEEAKKNSKKTKS
jgi:hypothetical protein